MDANAGNMSPGGLFHNIREIYGGDICYRCKDLVNLNRKLASLKNRVVFLLQCRRKHVFPEHIIGNIRHVHTLQIEEHPYTKLVEKCMKKFRKSVLNIEIKISLWKKAKTENSIKVVFQALLSRLDPSSFIAVRNLADGVFHSSFHETRIRNVRKLCRLEEAQVQPFTATESDTFVVNYTTVDIPQEVKSTLGLGPKHGIIPRQVPRLELIKDIEDFTQHITDNEVERNSIRARCVGIINNFLRNGGQQNDPLAGHYSATARFVKDHPEIIICSSDKGNSTVLMYKDQYMNEAENMLGDEATYSLLTVDPTKRLQDRVNKFVKTLKIDGKISEADYKSLISHNSVSPKIYFLRKTHKEGLKLRPIVSCINSPTHKIGRYIHTILNSVLSTSVYNVKNSHTLVEELRLVEVPDDYVLVSLDVVSLFTNIPKCLLKTVLTQSWHYIKNFTFLEKQEFLQMVDLCFDGGYFVFCDRFFKQKDGTPMGAPESPSFADIVMHALFRYAVSRLNFTIPLIKLYVDDTLLLIPKSQVETTLNVFNSYHRNIRFTLESEKDCSIPFLDLLIIRENNKLITNWYTKPSNSGRCINYLSNHSYSQKKNVAFNLVNRAVSLSDEMFIPQNLEKVTKILRKNNYPPHYIKTIINEYKKKKQRVQFTPGSEEISTSVGDSVKKFTRLVMYPKLSYQINRVFREYNMTAAFYNKTNIKRRFFTKLKDDTPILKQSEVIYKIPCGDCEKCYVGQTKQLLQDRIRQHKNDVNKKERGVQRTSLAAHAIMNSHNFDFSGVSILDRESRYSRRLISEMIHIQRQCTVNFREDTQDLSAVYHSLIADI